MKCFITLVVSILHLTPNCIVYCAATLLKMRVSIAVPSLQRGERLQSTRSRKHSELEIQMVIVLLVITTVFVLSWGPLDVRQLRIAHAIV